MFSLWEISVPLVSVEIQFLSSVCASRRVHREREQLFERNMRLFCCASPADVGVPLKLFPQDPLALKGSYPYESAVQELKLLVQDCCPQRKLECVGKINPNDFLNFKKVLLE